MIGYVCWRINSYGFASLIDRQEWISDHQIRWRKDQWCIWSGPENRSPNNDSDPRCCATLRIVLCGWEGLCNGSDCTTCLDPSFPRTACVRSPSGTQVCMYSTVTYNCEQLQPADLCIYSTPVYSANTITYT